VGDKKSFQMKLISFREKVDGFFAFCVNSSDWEYNAKKRRNNEIEKEKKFFKQKRKLSKIMMIDIGKNEFIVSGFGTYPDFPVTFIHAPSHTCGNQNQIRIHQGNTFNSTIAQLSYLCTQTNYIHVVQYCSHYTNADFEVDVVGVVVAQLLTRKNPFYYSSLMNFADLSDIVDNVAVFLGMTLNRHSTHSSCSILFVRCVWKRKISEE
jgi:hypothetical protein